MKNVFLSYIYRTSTLFTLSFILASCGGQKSSSNPNPAPSTDPIVDKGQNNNNNNNQTGNSTATISLSNLASLTKENAISFSLSSDSNLVTSYQCAVDSQSFSSCTTSMNIASLSDGAHTLTVKGLASDLSVLGTTSAGFTVDRTPPTSRITTYIASPTAATSATLEFVGEDAGSGVKSFECKLDTGSFAACTSPVNLTGLTSGVHGFTVRAIDRADNIGSGFSHGWTIDTSVPTAQITSNPAPYINSTSASFSFAGINANRFECKLDSANYAACTSPVNLTGLTEGAHTFSIKAFTAAGVSSAAQSVTFTVDLTAPTVNLSSSVSTPTALTSATMTLSATDSSSGVQGFECKLDSASFASCTSPVNLTGLASGSHTFSVRAKDNAQNVSPTHNFTWSILIAPSITTQPTALTVKLSQAATFSVVASGSDTLSYQWKKAGQDISGATSSSYTISATATSDEALYQVRVSNAVGSVLSNAVNLWVHRPPTITTQPTSLTLNEGASQATFTVVASGRGSLSYQWLKDNQVLPNQTGKISGATTASLTISNITPSDQAWYTVLVTDTLNGVQQTLMSDYRNLVVIPSPPTITSHPSSLTVNAGSSVSFSASASGTSISYQWLKNGVAISGATASTYSITSAQASDAASYSLLASNTGGSVTSNPATLTIHSPPTISSQPSSATAYVGGSATFSVTASGSGSLSYQWFKGTSALSNSSTVSGATTAQLSLSNLQTSAAGSYSVRVTSSLNGTTQTTISSSATLTVNAYSGIARFNVLKVAMSKDQSCALLENDGNYPGAVYCWGAGSPNRSMTPSLVGTYATNIFGAANGDAIYALGLIPGGAQVLVKWTSTTTSAVGVPGTFVGAITSAFVSDDGNSYCAVATNNVLKCHQEHTLYPLPTSITGGLTKNSYDFSYQLPAQPSQVILGDKFGCALVNGQVYCWGSNDNCQISRTPFTTETPYVESSWYQCYLLGSSVWAPAGFRITLNAQPVAFASPDRITSFGENIRQIALSDHSLCAIGDSGNLKCLGSNHDSDFPLTNTWSLQSQTTPPQYRLYSIGTTPTATYADNTHVNYDGHFVLGALGPARPTFGEAPPNTARFYFKAYPAFEQIFPGTSVSQIFSSYLMVSNSGELKLWGKDRAMLNLNYQAPDPGISGGVTSYGAVSISGISGSISQVERTTKALFFRQNGGIKVLGLNPNGLIGLGAGAPTFVQSAASISSLQSGVSDIVTSKQRETVCALQNGKVYCWGDNASGMVGNGTTTSALSPVLVQ